MALPDGRPKPEIYEMVRIVAPESIILGSDVVIDDFVFIGRHKTFIVGNRAHIASHVSLTGGGAA